MVVQGDDAQRIGRALLEALRAQRQAVVVDRTSLLAPRPDRVEPDDDDVIRDVERFGRPDALPLVECARESCREGVRISWFPGTTKRGSSSGRRSLAAVSSSVRRPRCAMSPWPRGARVGDR